MKRASLTRRQWLHTATALAAASTTDLLAQPSRRPKIAAVFTELRLRSHAYNFLVNLLGTYLFRGQRVDPQVDIVSLYADQFPTGDMTRDVSRRFNIPLFQSIDEALCLGGKSLAVDAVLLIGEHGQYPVNALGQRMYPRKEFWDQIVTVMRRSQRFVPVFNDKHLSYRWDWSKSMFDEARELGIPLMAGSIRLPPTRTSAAAGHSAVQRPVGQFVSVHGIEQRDCVLFQNE